MIEQLPQVVFAHLKTVKGSKLEAIVLTTPDRLTRKTRPTDAPLNDFVFEAIHKLIGWGLVEAYNDGRLLTMEELNSSSTRLTDVTFYVSRNALEIEEAFSLRLDAPVRRVFGQPNSQFVNWPQVFVLMPFSPDLRPVYEDHIRKVVMARDLRIARADDFFLAGSIMADIATAISECSFVIADCTGRNANVFYEIGMAHAMGKRTILVSQNIDDVPFDLRHLRVLIYEYTPRGMATFEEALARYVEAP